MERGIRGLKKCPPDDCVWGLRGIESVEQGQTNKKRYDAAVRVRAKVSPFAFPHGSIGRGETPSEWSVGPEYGFAHSVRSNWHPAQISSGHKYCMCSRAAYVDGKQRYVNYLMHGDPLESGGYLYWHQLDLETEQVTTYLLGFQDETGSYGYDADLDTHTLSSGWEFFWNPFSPYYQGHDYAVEPTHPVMGIPNPWTDHLASGLRIANSVANSQPPFGMRPDGYCAGKKYLSFSGYFNSDSQNEEDLFGCVRYNHLDGGGDSYSRWYYTASKIKDPSIRFALVRPAVRAYMTSADDEPWWCAYDSQTNSIGTGRWRASSGPSLLAEIENTYPLPSWLKPYPNILHYTRMHGRDLFIIRDHAEVFPGGAGGARSAVLMFFDGSTWIPATRNISCIACDEEGGIYYGTPRYIAKHNSWEHNGTGVYGQFDSFDPPPNVPPEDPETDPDPPAPPAYTAPDESHFFQIMVGKSRLHLRGFYGQHELATGDLLSAEWADYEIANRTNCRNNQAIDGDFWSSWTFSRDGTVRVPHTQGQLPYALIGETVRRIVRRQYVARDMTEYYKTNLIDSLDRDVYWPKYLTCFFPFEWSSGLENFFPWMDEFGWSITPALHFNGFSTSASGGDFDIAEGCDCCCRGNFKNY